MKILIAGGYGYIGASLSQHFYNLGHEIFLASQKNKKVLNWLPKAKSVKLNYENLDELKYLTKDIDIIIQASGTNTKDSFEDPEKALFINGLATSNLFEAANVKKLKCFIYFSSYHVYSKPLLGNINENMLPTNLHPYATTHLVGEHAVLNKSKKKKIKGIVFRLSNAYGIPLIKNLNSWKLVINDLCKQAIVNKKLIIKTNGLQKRNFIALEDMCRAVEMFIEKKLKNDTPEIINLGGEKTQTIKSISFKIQERCMKIFNYKPEIKFLNNIKIKNTNKDDFNYQIDLLKKNGFNFFSNQNDQIDNLLLFCRKSFL